MKLEKYKNYIDIVSFTHGVPNINFNKNNLNQIISYNPLFIFFSGGGIFFSMDQYLTGPLLPIMR